MHHAYRRDPGRRFMGALTIDAMVAAVEGMLARTREPLREHAG